MALSEFLGQQREDLPRWLERFGTEDAFPREDFFRSRVVYYPGSGSDGHPVQVFGSSHSAHTFVYVDYGVTQAALEAELGHPQCGFRGYHSLARVQLRGVDLAPSSSLLYPPSTDAIPSRYRFATVVSAPFGLFEVLERDRNLDDRHGPRRLAIVFLGADGIAAYDGLFCRGEGQAPFAVVLQDHGFGGNYDRFGAGGLLERIALTRNVLPRWLLVADNTTAWTKYRRVPDVERDPGGRHGHVRFIYRRNEDEAENEQR